MELNERQYQRVARYLDGEPVQLSETERQLAEEIRQAERELAPKLEVQPPGETVERALRRITAALARRRRRVLPFIAPAVAAAAIVVAVAAMHLWPSGQAAPEVGAITLEALAEAYASEDEDIDLDLIARELDELEVSIVVPLPADPVEAEIDALQQELDAFWLEEVRWPGES